MKGIRYNVGVIDISLLCIVTAPYRAAVINFSNMHGSKSKYPRKISDAVNVLFDTYQEKTLARENTQSRALSAQLLLTDLILIKYYVAGVLKKNLYQRQLKKKKQTIPT